MKRLGLFALVMALGGGVALANSAGGELPVANRYRLTQRDVVRLVVNGESDVSLDRRIDGQGEVNVPLLGQIKIAGLTALEVQHLLTQRYVADEIFVRPEVVVTVLEYAPLEVMVLGQVGKQGKQLLPPEAASLSIVEAITSAGGLTRIARGDAVRVTRKDDKGQDQAFTVNVEKLIQGKTADGFQLQAGDVVFVPERTF